MKFYVTLIVARTFGQTGAGCHASVGTDALGVATTAAEAVAMAHHALDSIHVNRAFGILVLHYCQNADANVVALKQMGNPVAALERMAEIDAGLRLMIGWGSVVSVEISTEGYRSPSVQMDGANLAYQRALLGGA